MPDSNTTPPTTNEHDDAEADAIAAVKRLSEVRRMAEVCGPLPEVVALQHRLEAAMNECDAVHRGYLEAVETVGPKPEHYPGDEQDWERATGLAELRGNLAEYGFVESGGGDAA